MKITKILIIILSIIGASNVLMPWLEYPQINKVLMGSDGDGILMSIGFILIILFQFIPAKVVKLILSSIVSLGIAYIIFNKINQFNYEIENFVSDDPLIGVAAAGASIRYGVYLVGIVSVLISILLITQFITLKKEIKINKKTSLIIGLALVAIAIFSLNKCNENSPIPKEAQLELLKSEFSELQSSLIKEDYEKFIDMTHPYIYQSVGGRRKLATYLHQSFEGVKLSNSQFEEIIAYHNEGEKIQVLFTNSMDYHKDEELINSTQRTIGFSNDNGKTWVFSGIEGQSFDNLKKYIPELFEEIRWE